MPQNHQGCTVPGWVYSLKNSLKKLHRFCSYHHRRRSGEAFFRCSCRGSGNLILFYICFKLNIKTGAAVNLCLLIFNLLPNINLDGGQILFRILENFFNFQICLKIYIIISLCVAIFLSLVGIIMIMYFKNPTLLFTGIMLLFSSLYIKF